MGERPRLLPVLVLLLAGWGSSLAGAQPDGLEIEMRSCSGKEEGPHATVTCVAVVENVTAVRCEHEFVLLGRKADGGVAFSGEVGTLSLERFQRLEIEISAKIPPGVWGRVDAVDLLTESACFVAGIDPRAPGAGRAQDVKREILEKDIRQRQRDLWQERHHLLAELDRARERGDGDAAEALERRVREIEERMRRHERRRRRLER